MAFDAEEEKGDKAARYWLGVLDNAVRWRPYWEDANAMAQDGVDVRGWIEAGVGQASPVRPVSVVKLPASLEGMGGDGSPSGGS